MSTIATGQRLNDRMRARTIGDSNTARTHSSTV
jgi:hypothetical protein